MKRQILSIALALCMLLSALPMTVFAVEKADIFASGDGKDETTAYTIATLEQLEAFRDSVNNGETYNGMFVKLGADIDMSEKYGADKESWAPIGGISPDSTNLFHGTFDGDGYVIKNMYINLPKLVTANLGFFSKLKGTVKNLGFVGGTVFESRFNDPSICDTTGNKFGAVAGINEGAIESCYNESFNFKIANCGSAYYGGICGYNGTNGKIVNCYNSAKMDFIDNRGSFNAGGICGDNESVIENCYDIGSFSFNGIMKPKGICCDNYASIKNCYTLNSIPIGSNREDTGAIADNVVTITDAQLKQQATFVGFDFDGDDAVWKMTALRPILKNAPEAGILADAPTVSVLGAEVTYGQYTDKKIGVTVTNQEGYTYSYQWYDSFENKISGATENTYTVPNNLTAGSHDYYCVVTAKRSDNGETASTKKKITVAVNKGTASFTEPTAQNDITYGATLDTVGLTDGWTWADGNTVPTVTNNGYTAYFTPTDTANYDWESVTGWNTTLKRVERTVAVNVNKVNQSAPTGITNTAETVDGKADGKIAGVRTAMEYRKEGDTDYTAITGTEIIGLADGKYYVRYKADDNHNASDDTEITVATGRKLTVTVPTTQVGYTLTVNKTELVWNDSTELTFALANGYSKLDTFAVNVNGNLITLDANGKCTVNDIQSDIAVTVVGVADITAPTGEIKLGTNSWKTFLNNITFGLFFKDTQEITIIATDNGSENVKIEYLLSDKELTVEELATATFTAYSDKFTVEPNNEYVIYAKLSDKTGNVAYINSNGIVLDNVAPVISGITNGETYCAAQTVTVSDKYDVTVTVNGTPITLDANGQFTLTPAIGTQTVVATDKAGNVSVEMIVTVNDGHTYEWQNENGQYWQKCKFCGNETAKKDIPEITVNGADKVCETQDYKFSFTLPEGSTDVTYGYKFENKSDGGIEPEFDNGIYSDTIPFNVLKDDTSFTLVVGATTADGYLISARKDVQILPEHTGGTATCTEKAECEVCGEEYGEVDNNNHSNLNHIEAKAATTEAEGNIEYWHCEDCDKYFSDKDCKNEITLADTVIAKLTKTDSDNKSPATGDNSHMALWFALLFVSGGLLIGTVASGKKRKYSAK